LSLVTGEVNEEGAVDDKRLAGLIQPVAAAAGMDLETVQVTKAGKRRRLIVVVDADGGVSHTGLDSVSREISAVLDTSNAMGEVPYTLEVTSPGVDRPLTEPKHWRRAARRLVKVKVAGEGTIMGRVVAADEAGVILDVDGARRELGYSALGPGAMQVEFGRLPDDDEFAEDELDDDELADDELEEDDLVKDDEAGDKARHGAGGDGH
jgi:ribosome maturation factor RimP